MGRVEEREEMPVSLVEGERKKQGLSVCSSDCEKRGGRDGERRGEREGEGDVQVVQCEGRVLRRALVHLAFLS
jgi:hypothetical protein